MVQPVPISPSVAGCPLLLQLDLLERLLSDPLGQIVAVLVALGTVILAAIRNELIKGYLKSGGKRMRFFAERNRRSDEIHHQVGVWVSNILWIGVFQYLEEDPIAITKETLSVEGFTWLSTLEVKEGTLDRQNCWRRPFSFREIHEGFAIDRERAQRGGRENVTEALLDELDGGGVHAVVGHPGSGKSTICKAVATRWYDSDDLGPVFYRPSGVSGEVSEPAGFRERIEVGKRIGPVLVVVEDAVRSDTVPIFEIIKEYLTDEDVSFLLDAREHEWDPESFGDVLRTRVERPDTSHWRELRVLQSDVDRHDVPPLDVREVERTIERFEKVTGREVREDAQQILRRIRLEEEDVSAGGRRSGMWPSPMLLLTYHFPIGEEKSGDGGSSSLENNVVETLELIEDTDTKSLGIETADLLHEVALLVNILNASNIGVYEELLYALADTDEEYDAIERCMAELNGWVLFGRSSETRYWSNHPLWSELYLERFLDENRNTKRWARERFEECVNAVFGVVDEEERRERIQRKLGQATDEFRQIKESPTERADEYVAKIFNLGTARPKLAPLFSTSEYSRIRVPETCSGRTRSSCSIWRSKMYVTLGEYPKAKEEVEAFRDIGQEFGVDEREVQSVYLLNLGLVAENQDDYKSARKYFKKSLDIFRDIGDRHNEATTLSHLGGVAFYQDDYERALTYYEKSLEIFRDIGNRSGEASSLNNLGLVAQDQGDYESAREYYEESLAIERDLGNRRGNATTLHNLGSVAQDQGDYESAREYYEESLAIERDIDNRRGEATTLRSLGSVAYEQGDSGSALTYYEESLAIERDLGNRSGNATTLNNLGLVAKDQGDYERALTYFEESLEISRAIGNRSGEASSLNNLGLVAKDQGDSGSALTYYEESLAIERDIGDRRGEAITLSNLGSVAYEQGDSGSALTYYEESLAIERDLGNRRDEASTLSNLGSVAIYQGNSESAREYYEESLEIFRKIGAIRLVLHSLANLVFTCRLMEDGESAIEWCRIALSTIDESDLDLTDERQRFESSLAELQGSEE